MTKDFATEPNEETLRQAAHRMAQKLAGSLALVTCKEPLRSNLSSHMRQFLNEQGFTEVFSLVSVLRPMFMCFYSRWLQTKLCCYLSRIILSSLAAPSRKRRWIVPLPMSTRTLRHLTSSAGAIVRYWLCPTFYSDIQTDTCHPRQIVVSLSGMCLQ